MAKISPFSIGRDVYRSGFYIGCMSIEGSHLYVYGDYKIGCVIL